MSIVIPLFSVACLSGCSDGLDPTRPAVESGAPLTDAPVTTDSLCTRLEFTMQGDGTVSVVYPNRSTCGIGMVVIPGGTPSRNDRTINIPVRLLNKSGSSVLSPLRVLLPFTHHVILDPAGAWPGHVQVVNHDSVRSNPQGDLWLITPAAPVAVNDSSSSRSLQFNVDQGINSARLALVVEATRPSDTARPVVPSPTQWPTPLLVTSSTDTSLRYRRNVYNVVFEDTTSGQTINAFLAQFNATVIGAVTGSETMAIPGYYIKVSDPGSTWNAVDSLRAAMAAYPRVALVGPAPYGLTIKIRSRYPTDFQPRSAWPPAD